MNSLLKTGMRSMEISVFNFFFCKTSDSGTCVQPTGNYPTKGNYNDRGQEKDYLEFLNK